MWPRINQDLSSELTKLGVQDFPLTGGEYVILSHSTQNITLCWVEFIQIIVNIIRECDSTKIQKKVSCVKRQISKKVSLTIDEVHGQN